MITLRNGSQWLVDKIIFTEVTWKQQINIGIENFDFEWISFKNDTLESLT